MSRCVFEALTLVCVCVVCAGALALQVTCFSEAERIYMLAKDTSISGKQLTCLVIPEIMVHTLALSLPLSELCYSGV